MFDVIYIWLPGSLNIVFSSLISLIVEQFFSFGKQKTLVSLNDKDFFYLICEEGEGWEGE